ncbi:GNAT family N-acetyltransferase [Celeribacter halophilus]|uniref:Ribosomal protein S18 acetylase RimI n=1 Tax=Celeribacter halophilus TaxID=576117 RepID=A0A1I3PDC8_9RHOB|nr:GNAT family N-acetyltransferase [Celeribacter halophilus]PZX14857.1 ribosomal protein S18 acetylase RimI-like enzyme [Celeribacter halophilus]SFJ19421.1 Ribosomal protein S18 acetylase RimI [Celeribacter halophilus]
MTTRIRKATRDDIPDMAAIVVGWEKDMPWMPEGPTTDMIETAMDEVFDLRDIHVVSETPSETIVGYMSVDPDTDKIGAIYLTATGQGHGKALIDLAKQGRRFLWLQTHQPNTRAHRFYEREGFKVMGEIGPDAEGTPAQYRMEWAA